MRYRALLLLTVGILSLTACGGSDESAPFGSAAAQPTGEPAPEAIAATKLAGDYSQDEAAADARFKGKMIDVTGMVVAFGTNKSDVSYVNLQGTGYGDDAGTAVQCVLTESGTEVLSELRVMEAVTIRGTVQGFGESVKDSEGQVALFISTGLDLTISDCFVVR
ncbi:MAG: hypothetical protein IH956_04920, partial [Chloroflexi bacterium]|nr:hypothetical protein [Chloroflexota bacterium]